LSPTPGCKTFTQHIPISNEKKDAVKNQPSALPPIRPTDLMSPSLAIPTTSVVKTSGAIIICTKRIKTVASILIYVLNSLASSSVALLWMMIPSMAPIIIAIRICVVRFEKNEFLEEVCVVVMFGF
jgi:hypothetical protein